MDVNRKEQNTNENSVVHFKYQNFKDSEFNLKETEKDIVEVFILVNNLFIY